jgi:hypothetical protein
MMKPQVNPAKLLLVFLRIAYLCICGWAIAAFLRPGEGIPPAIEAHPFAAFLFALGVSQLVIVLDFVIRKKRIEIITSIFPRLFRVLCAKLRRVPEATAKSRARRPRES